MCVHAHTRTHKSTPTRTHTQLLSWEFSPSGLPGPQVTAAVSPVGSSGPWSALRPLPEVTVAEGQNALSAEAGILGELPCGRAEG